MSVREQDMTDPVLLRFVQAAGYGAGIDHAAVVDKKSASPALVGLSSGIASKQLGPMASENLNIHSLLTARLGLSIIPAGPAFSDASSEQNAQARFPAVDIA